MNFVANTTEIYSIIVLEGRNPKSTWGNVSLLLRLVLASRLPAILGIPWFAVASFQSLPLPSRGILPVSLIFHVVSVSSLGVITKVKLKPKLFW